MKVPSYRNNLINGILSMQLKYQCNVYTKSELEELTTRELGIIHDQMYFYYEYQKEA